MYLNITEAEVERMIAGITVTFTEKCEVGLIRPRSTQDVIFLQPIIDGRGPTIEEVESYAEVLKNAFAVKGLGEYVDIGIEEMPIPERFGTSRTEGFSSILVKIRVI